MRTEELGHSKMSVNRLAILEDRNIKKEPEMILKYEDLTTEIDRMWNIKDTIGTITESLRKYLSNTAGRHVIKELQKQPYCAPHTYFGTY